MTKQTTTNGLTANVQGIQFSDTDIANPDDFIPKGEFNPHNIHPFILHDHGFIVCVVFASHLQDALDEAVDQNKMDRYQVTQEEFATDYDSDEERVTFLGNASEMFDIESLGVIELANPAWSFVAMFNANNNNTK